MSVHMTRAHFELIASVVRNCCDTCKIPKSQRLQPNQMLQMSEPFLHESEETMTVKEHLAAVETMEQLIKLQYAQINVLKEQLKEVKECVARYERFVAQVGMSVR